MRKWHPPGVARAERRQDGLTGPVWAQKIWFSLQTFSGVPRMFQISDFRFSDFQISGRICSDFRLCSDFRFHRGGGSPFDGLGTPATDAVSRTEGEDYDSARRETASGYNVAVTTCGGHPGSQDLFRFQISDFRFCSDFRFHRGGGSPLDGLGTPAPDAVSRTERDDNDSARRETASGYNVAVTTCSGHPESQDFSFQISDFVQISDFGEI